MDERQMILVLHRVISNLKRTQNQLLRKHDDVTSTDVVIAVREINDVTKSLERILREL